MPLVRERDGARLHVKSILMGESLVATDLEKRLPTAPQVRLFPDVNVLKIGGQSICDRGARALPGILRELVACKEKHKMLLTSGGGTRSRHIYAIGLELGMPTGVIAAFGSAISEQNALLLSMLLSRDGGIKIDHDSIVKLNNYFARDCIPVMAGMPPYDYYVPPTKGRIPAYRTDVGTIMLADLIGAKSCLYVKDVDGLYEDNPKNVPDAPFVARIGAKALMERNFPDLVVERPCLEILQDSEVLEQIQIVNGMTEGNITRALAGEPVGTVIFKE